MISVLFAAKDSVYKTIPGLDVWDEERNALAWPGGNPGIFHPPCRLFSMLRLFSHAPQSEKELAYWAVDKVRENGGILEHPAFSKLWSETDLPEVGYSDRYGFTMYLEQYWFGHPCKKKTWLYICGADSVPPVPSFARSRPYQNVFTGHGRKAPARRRAFSSATPIEFAKWLVTVTERCNPILTPHV